MHCTVLTFSCTIFESTGRLVLWCISVSDSCMGCPPLAEVHCIHPNIPRMMVIVMLNITMMNAVMMLRPPSFLWSFVGFAMLLVLDAREFEHYRICEQINLWVRCTGKDTLSDNTWIDGGWKMVRGSNALCRSWKTGFKVVNFEQLFIHQFWTKMSQIFNDDV